MEVTGYIDDCIILINNEIDYKTMLNLYNKYAEKDNVLLSKIKALLTNIVMKDYKAFIFMVIQQKLYKYLSYLFDG
jgi:hypothetical protein